MIGDGRADCPVYMVSLMLSPDPKIPNIVPGGGMSISSSNRKAGPYTGNGVTVSFAFAFKVFQAADVLVVQTDLSGVETTKTLTTDYTVTLNANQDTNPGGTVTMIVAPPTGYLLTLGSQVSYTQGMVLTNTGGFFPQVLNDMADRVVILVQQLFEKLNRALTLPFSVSSSVSTQLPSPVAGKVIGWRADGLGLDNYDPGTAVGLFVSKSATSGSAILPGGPTANRDAVPGQGFVRFNSNTNVLEWYNGASWVSVTDATALAAGLQLGGLNTLTKSGDQFLMSQDVSGLREGSCSVASGDLYTLLGGTAASLSMKYQAHNFTINTAGMLGPRDETGDGWLKVTTEGSQERYYYVKSGTAGVAPVAGDFTLMATFDYTTGGMTVPTVQGLFKNLQASSTGTNATVTETLDEIVVEDSNGFYKTIKSISLSINTASSGANGLDTGAVATSTWYSKWVIYNPATNTAAGLISLSATAPAMPSGYTFKARTGWIRTDGTANKYPLSFVQFGRNVRYKVAAGSNLAAIPIISSGAVGSVTIPTWVAVGVSNFVPPTASQIMVQAYSNGASGVIVAPNNSYGAYNSANTPPLTAWGGEAVCVMGSLALESTNLYVAGVVSTQVNVSGWEDNL